MTGAFTKTALSFCMGLGTIALKGKQKRPWLSLKRCEAGAKVVAHEFAATRVRTNHAADRVQLFSAATVLVGGTRHVPVDCK